MKQTRGVQLRFVECINKRKKEEGIDAMRRRRATVAACDSSDTS